MKDHIILGPYLEDKKEIFSTVMENKQQKQELIDLLNETLQEIAPSCYRMNINTKMGFNIGILQKYMYTHTHSHIFIYTYDILISLY